MCRLCTEPTVVIQDLVCFFVLHYGLVLLSILKLISCHKTAAVVPPSMSTFHWTTLVPRRARECSNLWEWVWSFGSSGRMTERITQQEAAPSRVEGLLPPSPSVKHRRCSITLFFLTELTFKFSSNLRCCILFSSYLSFT